MSDEASEATQSTPRVGKPPHEVIADRVAGVDGYEPPGFDHAPLSTPPDDQARPGPSAQKRRRKRTAAESGQRRERQSDKLMSALGDLRLWCSPSNDGYAFVPAGDHTENWPINSLRMREHLSLVAFDSMGEVPGPQTIESVIRILTAQAIRKGERREPWMRVGRFAGDDRIFIDLCDEEWRVVEVGPNSQRVRAMGDLPFIRTPAMRALPEPEFGEGIERLRSMVNASDADFTLIAAWAIAALRPSGPFPILILNGQQGSGKSTFSRMLRSLVDPNAAPIRTPPVDDRTLIISAMNSHVLCFDNLSRVEPWCADALCRLSTGGGFTTRALHTNTDEIVFNGQRPIILNGIPSLTDRPDLADRAIIVRLEPIQPEQRMPEDEHFAAFEAAAPAIFGALLTAVSAGLRHAPSTKLATLPRLADFAKWVTAAEPGFGWQPGTFMDAYDGNRSIVSSTAFESNLLAVAVLDFALEQIGCFWNGTATQLLNLLNVSVQESVRHAHAWPKTPIALGNGLDRAAQLLRDRGIIIERHHSAIRTITIRPAAGMHRASPDAHEPSAE